MTSVKQQLELINNDFIKLNIAFYSALFMSLMFYFYYMEITQYCCLWNHDLIPSIDNCHNHTFLELITAKQDNDFYNGIQNEVGNSIMVDCYDVVIPTKPWHNDDVIRQEVTELMLVIPQQETNMKIQNINLLMSC